jgi:hypothetical protein
MITTRRVLFWGSYQETEAGRGEEREPIHPFQSIDDTALNNCCSNVPKSVSRAQKWVGHRTCLQAFFASTAKVAVLHAKRALMLSNFW